VTSQERAHMIHSAINDYYYVVNNSTPGFILLPEIFLRIGEAHVLLDAPVAALEAFAKARELKADYWPAYARAAEVLERVGKKTAARSLLGDGLRLMPDEPALQSAYKRLGGNPTDVSAASPAPSDSAAPR
jgi:tetratricopeptide (TPR) repeat protein